MTLLCYLASLIGAITLGSLLNEDVGLILAFAFVCWLGGWFARELRDRRLESAHG